MARVKIQITTPSNNVIKVSPGVSALSSVQLYLNELIDVNTQHGADGYVLTQQADGTFAMEAVATTLADLSDTNILNPQGGESLVYDANTQKWVPGGVKSVNGQDGDVVITIPSPPPTPGVSGLADTNITNLQDDQIIRYDSASGNWLNEDLEALPSGGTTGQALVKASNTDYDVTWDDIAVDIQFHQRYATEAETLRSGATETVELYFFAQGDGNGLAESASSDTPTSGYDIRRKLYYAEKAQADPDTSADWTQFTAIADNTTFNNAKAALLAYLKERTGGTVPISLKMTWEEVAQAPAFTGLLNESYGSGAEAAYSTRRLNGNVTECMVIRRASDSTTTTIGFDSEGNIDEAAIETFCSGTSCTVYEWRDQSGNGNHATAAAPANEPTIYTGGQLVKEGGRLAVDFDGSNDAFDISITNAASDYSFFAVNKADTENHFLLDSQTGRVILDGRGSTSFGVYYDGSWKGTRHSGTSQQLQSIFMVSPSSGASYIDGSQINTGLNYTQTAIGGTTVMGSNYLKSSLFYEGTMQEILLYASDKSTDRTDIESNIGDYFTQNTPLLDTYSGAAAAYSLRLLDSTYTGALINVWNGTSYADIYPNVFGELDTVALAAHCGSNDGFIRYWYDQSSNSNDATQTTTANMPKIYDGTTGVVTENGKPAVQFIDASSTQMSFTSFAPSSDFSVIFVAQNGANNNDYMLTGGGAGNLLWASSTTQFRARINFTFYDFATSIGSGSQYLGFLNRASNSLTFAADSNLSASTFTTSNALTLSNLSYGGANGYNFKMSEVILYPSDQSSNRTNIEDNINTFYNIY